MKRFMGISINIIIVFVVFFIGSKVIFKDMVHVNNYEEKNIKEINIDLEEEAKVKEGIVFKFKIKNNSKYTYRIDDARLVFSSKNESKSKDDDYIEYDLYSSLELKTHEKYKEYDDIYMDNNYKNFIYGIKPNKEGYIEFLLPKGLNLDKEYFDLNVININIDSKYTVDLPFSESGYITVEKNNQIDYSFDYEIDNTN